MMRFAHLVSGDSLRADGCSYAAGSPPASRLGAEGLSPLIEFFGESARPELQTLDWQRVGTSGRLM